MGTAQVYFDGAAVNPADQPEWNYYSALMCYLEEQTAEELDAFLVQQHAYRTPGKAHSKDIFDVANGINTAEWCFTVTDTLCAERVARFCNELVGKYDPKEKLKSPAGIHIYSEDGWLVGSLTFHGNRYNDYR